MALEAGRGAEGVDGDGDGRGDDDLLLHLGGRLLFFPFPFSFLLKYFLSFWEAVVGFAGFR
jgi:hypothetical protein